MSLRRLIVAVILLVGIAASVQILPGFIESFKTRDDLKVLTLKACLEGWSPPRIRGAVVEKLRESGFELSADDVEVIRDPATGAKCTDLTIEVSYRLVVSLFGREVRFPLQASAESAEVSERAYSRISSE